MFCELVTRALRGVARWGTMGDSCETLSQQSPLFAAFDPVLGGGGVAH